MCMSVRSVRYAVLPALLVYATAVWAADPSASTQRFMKEFSVDESRIGSLRDPRFSDDDIRRTLSLAQQMPGGITDENVDRIVRMRQDRMEWGRISRELEGRTSPSTSSHRSNQPSMSSPGRVSPRGVRHPPGIRFPSGGTGTAP
ncbi:MAG: hypothetical protein COV75_05590 [Candidatus Omnitrophica bacterium CG11_big_fil_rev_8_21_14_0_20_63_9]|nr:MAG: hypothetical protein COV75_05590 [Candidatus Omnitrophica bacterium CG11_big_fil_rev_8_21_14_0_20_63_9]